MGFVIKITRFLEASKQTTHHCFMGLLCTFELLSNTSKSKFKFKPIGTNEMCCLLSECSRCRIEKMCDKLQICKWEFFILRVLGNQLSIALG